MDFFISFPVIPLLINPPQFRNTMDLTIIYIKHKLSRDHSLLLLPFLYLPVFLNTMSMYYVMPKGNSKEEVTASIGSRILG